jgi:alcohol dehydrogenase class IV
MVKAFQFARLPRIIFRNGEAGRLPDHISGFGKKIAIVTGKHSFADTPAFQQLLDETEKRNITSFHIVIQGEPSPQEVDTFSAIATGEDIEAVVAIGGGSVLDAGKAIAAMATIGGSVERYLEGVGDLIHPGSKLPFIAVPTTSGTGSEATKNAVLSEVGPQGFKKSLRHDNFVPDLAILDPELTLTCPKEITAASGMDCFTQITEAYLSDKAIDYTDALALEGLIAVRDYLKRCIKDGTDIEARGGLSFAALTSGICLANAGLGIVHGFASSVGGVFNIPHGLVCGSLMAKANEVTVRELRKQSINGVALHKYSTLGRLFIPIDGKSDAWYVDAFISFLMEFTSELDFQRFSEYGMGENDILPICRNTENKNNPVRLGPDEMAEILQSRIF